MGFLPSLKDSQAEFTLLRSCLALPKFVFGLRTSPPNITSLPAKEFDFAVRAALGEVLGCPNNDNAWKQASLPTSLGGLELRSAIEHAPASYVSSVAQTHQLVLKILPSSVPPPPLEALPALPPT